jgi:HPt (histidine-containing phosphotransfer) domain-containing protein
MGRDIKTTKTTFKPQEEKDIQLLNKSIPNLDMQSGVRRFGDNERLYRKMLKKFISNNTQTCSELKKLISEEKFEQAHLMIHTLKGESGNIGANKVAKLALKVEKAVLTKDVPSFEKKLILLEKSMKDIITAVQNYFHEKNSETEKDLRPIKEITKELTENLKAKNPKTFDLLDELKEYNIKESDIKAIIKAVNSENPNEAIRLLKKLSDND